MPLVKFTSDVNTMSLRNPVSKAFKRLRVEGFRARQNISRKDVGKIIKTGLPFIYNIRPPLGYQISSLPRVNLPDLRFFFRGDEAIIRGIFESEGLIIKDMCPENAMNFRWLYLELPVDSVWAKVLYFV